MKYLNDFSCCLKISGYNNIELFNTIRGAVMRIEEMRHKVAKSEIVSGSKCKDSVVNNTLRLYYRVKEIGKNE